MTFPVIGAAAQEKLIDMSELISVTEIGEEYFEKNKEFYDEIGKDFRDPQKEGYTDADLFGKYENEEWVIESMLNYEDFPGLMPVESAAMEGNYELAKEELLKYYKEKFSQYPTITCGSATDQASLNNAILAMENVISNSNNKIVGLFKAEKTEKTISVDATDIVQSSVSGNESTLSFVLTAVRKDGNRVVIRSKESGENIPALTITVNGRPRTYEAVADTYIRAGKYSAQSFGAETELFCEESYSSIYLSANEMGYDSYTSRAIINFDLSDISSNDKITAAKLYVTGKAVESDNPTAPENYPDYTDVAVYKYRRATWDESSYSWTDDPEYITRQHTNASGWYSFLPNYGTVIAVQGENLLSVYNATLEPAYAYAAARQIQGACVKLMDEETGAKLWHSLNLASTMYRVPAQFADIIETPAITGECLALMMKFIHYATEALVNDRWTNNEEANNWGNINATAILQIAMTFNEFKKASEPLSDYKDLSYPGGVRGGWMRVGQYRMEYTNEGFLREDGSCIENSHGYTRYMLGATLDVFDCAEVLDYDVRQIFSEEYIERLEQYLLFLANLSTSDNLSFRQGDDSGEGNVLRSYESMIEVLDNPYLLWVCSEKKKGEAPDYLGYAYDVSQKATMRTGYDDSDMSIYINADGSVGSHSHNDDLALNLYAYGRMLLTDRRQEDYDASTPFGAMFYSTRGHNTIEVNSTSMVGKSTITDMTFLDPDGEEITIKGSGSENYVSGTLHPENREFNSMYHYIEAESFGYRDIPAFDENFETIREVLMVAPSYVIVTDVIRPDGSDSDDDENSFAQYWHMIPNANVSINDVNSIVKTNFSAGANLTIAPVIGSLPITASKHTSWYNNSSAFSDYVRLEKNTSGTATFNTVLYPTPGEKNIEIETNNISVDGFSEADASAFSFCVTDEESKVKTDVHYYNLLDIAKKKNVVFGNYQTNGELALIEEEASILKKTVLRNGSSIKTKSGTDIVKSEHYISDLGIKWDGGTVSLTSSREIAPISISGGTGTVSDENLALDKANSSGTQYANYASKNAFDGDVSTYWKSASDYSGNTAGEAPWLAVDFGKQEYISQIVVYDDYENAEYKFSYIDENGTWTQKVIKAKETEETENGIFAKKFDIEPFVSQHLKIESSDGSDMTIYELEAYSCLVGAISLYDLKIYAPDKVSKVLLNGESYPVYKNGDYIVFEAMEENETPILPEVKPETDTVPDHGYSGDSGSGGGGGGGSTENKPVPVVPIVPDVENEFSDELIGHWGEKEISTMVENGIVKGSDGSLNLTSDITRAEFAAILVRALKCDEVPYNEEFKDVEGNEWYANTISTASKIGIIEGYDGRVSPNSNITREQMAKMLVKAYEYLYPEEVFKNIDLSFEDTDNISDWAIPFVVKASEKRIMKGYDGNIFNPQGTALREQAFVALYRILFKEEN